MLLLPHCNGVYFFPQRVDDTPYVVGEDSSQAEDAVPGDTAEEGKPPSKLKTPHYLSLTFFYIMCILSCYYCNHMVWVYISYSRNLDPPHSLPIWEKLSRTPMIPTFCRDHHLALLLSNYLTSWMVMLHPRWYGIHPRRWSVRDCGTSSDMDKVWRDSL